MLLPAVAMIVLVWGGRGQIVMRRCYSMHYQILALQTRRVQ